MAKVIVCYAHGGTTGDPGCLSADKKIKERDYIKAFIDEVFLPALTKKGREYKTIQQQTWYTIDKQVNAAHKPGDICISFHLNASDDNEATGTETLCSKGSKNGSKLAILVNDAVVKTIGIKNRGIKEITREDRGGRLVAGTTPPAVLTELFFLTNTNDYKLANPKLSEIGTAVAEAIEKYFAK